MSYRPRPQAKYILDRAMEHIKSVPYPVSLRWLSYRLLQDGVYKSKEEFHKLKNITIEARKNFYGEWRPDTLIDDTRSSIYRHGDFETPEEWLENLKTVGVSLDEWHTQDYYVELWFEAQAMQSQFEYYTELVTLRPFKGDISIPIKWEIAKKLERYWKLYGKPIKILYFGDCDDKGKKIPWSAVNDIREWCSVDFDFEVCGLTLEQAKLYNLPENPEKPGEYQWEALPDQAAKEIIQATLNPLLNVDAIEAARQMEDHATAFFQTKMKKIIDEWIEWEAKNA